MLSSLGATQQAEALGALRTAVQEQVTFNISYVRRDSCPPGRFANTGRSIWRS